VEVEEYERHLVEQLCWLCHVPTHTSHRQQRQCPKCRRKWSFRRRLKQWQLLKLFGEHLSVRQAAKLSGCAYRTVHQRFLDWERIVRQSGFRWIFRNGQPALGPEETQAVLFMLIVQETVPGWARRD
jgi:hypothetical protein